MDVEMVNIELPKDAEGREIPLDTALLYGKVSGEEYEVVCFNFRPSVRQWRVELKRRDDLGIYATENFTLSPPDTWEKLLEDLDRALSTPGPDTYASITCGYFDSANVNCSVCEYMHGIKNETCNDDAWRDIASRIRKLSGEDE